MRRAILAGFAIFAAPALAHAQDATRQNALVAPRMTIDMGFGAGSPSFATTMLSDGAYRVSGASLGLAHDTSALFSASMHTYPFAFRHLGFLATVEMLLMSGPVSGKDGNGPAYYSVMLGPEAQARFGSFVVRAAALVGWRDLSYGRYDALDWRVGGRAQVDYLFGGHPNSLGLTMGVFGGVDALPGLGWTAGATLSYAIF